MKVALSVVKARRTRLAQLLRENQYLPVGEVCTRLGVSEATARRDLTALHSEKAITRTRGGAVFEYNQRFPSFHERLEVSTDGKQRIAEAACRMLRPGHTIWLDSGTTCYAIARRLADTASRMPPDGLTVVTNNLPAAELLADHEAISVHLSGGQYFRRSSLLVAGRALEMLKGWRFDLAFIGAEGLTAEGLWNSIADVVTVQRAIATGARRVVFCVDAGKVGKPAAEFLLPLSDVTQLLTDAGPDALRAAGIRLPGKRLVAA